MAVGSGVFKDRSDYDPPLKPGSREGYRRLRGLTQSSLLRLHDEAADMGETWDYGVRDPGSLDHMLLLLSEKAAREESPERIAACSLHFIVATHPFWDANHRTGFLVGRVVLQAFGRDVHASTEEAERFVRSIDGRGLTVKAVEEWIRSHLVKIR